MNPGQPVDQQQAGMDQVQAVLGELGATVQDVQMLQEAAQAGDPRAAEAGQQAEAKLQQLLQAAQQLGIPTEVQQQAMGVGQATDEQTAAAAQGLGSVAPGSPEAGGPIPGQAQADIFAPNPTLQQAKANGLGQVQPQMMA